MLAAMVSTIRILGIDPGLRATGWGVIELNGTRLACLDYGIIKPPVEINTAQRLRFIFEKTQDILCLHQPDEAAVEDQFVHTNPSAALKLGQARAAAVLVPAIAGLNVSEYAPRLVKKSIVGTGKADKNQVAAMISILLPGTKADKDAADALAVAICHANSRSQYRS